MKLGLRITAILLILTALLFCSCGRGGDGQVPLAASERILQDSKRLYKDAVLVATGVCVNTYVGIDGKTCSDVSITDVIAGSEAKDTLIHCADIDLKVSHEYLLYLSDSPQRDDPDGEFMFAPVGGSAFEISDDDVIWYGNNIKLEEIISNMSDYNDIITVPDSCYLHTELSPLVSGADEIFIGKVTEAVPKDAIRVKSYSGNTSQVSTPQVSLTKITVLGSIKGKLKYGDDIQMACITDNVLSMLNSVTLEPESYVPGRVVLPKKNAYYVFFLIDGPDPKQPYYFPVNPIQGWVSLDKDVISPNHYNTALAHYTTLEALLNAIKGA